VVVVGVDGVPQVTAHGETQQVPHASVQQVKVAVQFVTAQGWTLQLVPPTSHAVTAHGATAQVVALDAAPPLPSTMFGEQPAPTAKPAAKKLPRMTASSVFTSRCWC
jgi:hypothetical protein